MSYTKKDLAAQAREIRRHIMIMLEHAGSGHSAGALGITDVFVTLYFDKLKHDPKNPDWVERDRVILSNGHICPVLYATLASAGYFPPSALQTLRKFESPLQGHPHRGALPGVENSSGPLGQGLSIAAGLAYGLKFDELNNRVYCLMSDGEHQEGQVWESYLFAAKYNLHNLTVLIDRNQIQIEGFTEAVMPLESLHDKIVSFNWQVLEIDGHDLTAIAEAVQYAQEYTLQPTAIICHTTPGKGVAFMENKPEWHGKPPNTPEAQEALQQLREALGDNWRE
ncbi:MAG: transketolase [Candidatus Pacebacteria bacterium CG10_big_fil_rev_8_21_14_0_10_44_54]|nr:MAG: transketolase [Candidatus Pacebacteria bacterium CG10_big_fil_rev_8_21_14_0_10_44_54]